MYCFEYNYIVVVLGGGGGGGGGGSLHPGFIVNQLAIYSG